MMLPQQNVLLCYRGRYRPQVELLARKLRDRGLSVSYDREILTAPEAFDSEDVGWISIAPDAESEDVAWRAPLKNAIGNSEVVVFLIDPVDQTPNIFNEIAWVAKADRYAFVIFDTGAKSLSEESQGIWVSSLNINCAIALKKWEVPGYEYLFLAHQDPHELDARLDVVANRVQEYLERVRHNPPPPVRFFGGVEHVSQLKQLPLTRARKRRSSIQEEWCRAIGLQAPEQDSAAHEAVIEFAYRYEKGAAIEGDLIRPPGSPFRYPRSSEQKRFLRTHQIIERTRPGPREAPSIFAELARQAASIELTIESAVGLPQGFNPMVLLGTLPVTPVDDVTYFVNGSDYAIIFLDGAFIDFVYQICKASVRSWKLLTRPDELPARLSARPEEVREVLRADSSLEQLFFHCVQHYLRMGVPGASSDGTLPRAYSAPLSLMIGMAERFMLGRGYAQLAVEDPQFPALVSVDTGAPSTLQDIVLRKDYIAAVFVLTSAAGLDRIDPAIALQGCGMPLVCAALIQRAIAIVGPTTPLTGSDPPLRDRLAVLETAYIDFVTRQGLEPARAQAGLTPAHWAWQTPSALWDRVEQVFTNERQNGLRPSSLWRDPIVSTELAALLAREAN
jgi:hypothetical protein